MNSLVLEKKFRKIVLYTLLFHLVLILYLIFSDPLSTKPAGVKKVTVTSVALRPQVVDIPAVVEVEEGGAIEEEAAPPPPPTPKKEVQVKKKEAPPKKKEEAPAKKKEEPPKAEKKTSGKKSSLLKKAKEGLTKIEKGSSVPVKAGAALKGIDTLASLEKDEGEYTQELIRRLKLQLHLPEFGQVEVLLTLERSGKVSSVEVVGAASKHNRQYVEKTLPGINFSDFSKDYPKEERHTFALTLSNALD